MNVFADHADLDGHDLMSALTVTNRNSPMGDTLEFSPVELARGRVVFEGSPSARSSIRSARCMAAMV